MRGQYSQCLLKLIKDIDSYDQCLLSIDPEKNETDQRHKFIQQVQIDLTYYVKLVTDTSTGPPYIAQCADSEVRNASSELHM